MKTRSPFLASILLLSIPLSPVLVRAEDEKPANPPKAEQPKPDDSKKDDSEAPKAAPEDKEKSPDKAASEPKKEEKKGPAPQERFSRETPELLKSWEPALDEVRRATVQLTRDGKDIALGCSVHENGYILTKASEVEDKKGAFLSGIEARFPEGLRLPVKLADVHRPYDLALLKVDARGLRVMPWDDTACPEPGCFLAAATPMRLPVAVGVLSVNPRSLDESQKAYLGVRFDETARDMVKILDVTSGSPASKAGFVSDDVITSIDGKPVATIEEFKKTISTFRPYQTVKFVVKREKGDKELDATLVSRPISSNPPEDPRNMMSGTLSKNRRGYPDAMQHDMVLEPNEVGGPIVDLDGKVVGMNIARSGRIECFAIPAKTVKGLLSKVGEGQFFHPELDALRDERKNAEAALDRLKKDMEALSRRIKDAEAPNAEPTEEKDK